jgi:3-methyladenine DNA glycosylase AlkD
MNLTPEAQKLYAQINKEGTKLGDLRKIAKVIKRDHSLAMELWSTGDFLSRQLAILIMNKKLLSQPFVDQLFDEIQLHGTDERNQLADWLMANQLTKDKKTIALIESWENSPSIMQRRIFWYYQARLRWMGKIPPGNTGELLSSIEKNIEKEAPEVQWAMNFTTGWIGVYDAEYRSRCMAIGEKTGLYKDEKVAKGCTPSYLPDFIRMEAAKRNI